MIVNLHMEYFENRKNELVITPCRQSTSEMVAVLWVDDFILVDDNNKIYVNMIDDFYDIVHTRRR